MTITLIVLGSVLTYLLLGILTFFFGVRHNGPIRSFCDVSFVDYEPYTVVAFWPLWLIAEILSPILMGMDHFFKWAIKTGIPKAEAKTESEAGRMDHS